MIKLRFSGWVICRLATRPDPYDDPRGTRSGFSQFAYPGEPDLDRVIRMNDAPFYRPYTPPAEVTVHEVDVDGVTDRTHDLVGATVDLIDDAVFEGRNVVIASDAAEPIYPFHVAVSAEALELRRKRSPVDGSYPYKEYLPVASGRYVDLPELPAAYSGIDHGPTYTERVDRLRADLKIASEDAAPGIAERVRILETMLRKGPNFPFAMRWRLPLTDPPELVRGSIGGSGIDLKASEDWVMDFWFGAYDRDGQSFYCVGTLTLPKRR